MRRINSGSSLGLFLVAPTWAALALVLATGCAPQTEKADPSTLSSYPTSDPSVIVHLFEWRWDDVALECEQFLGPAGYRAVQVSPVTESALVKGRPWYEKYQPVSYTLDNRSGDRQAFASMVERCRTSGVDIVVDVVLNHMTGVYEGVGSAGSRFSEYDYPGLYTYEDFHHCGTEGDEIQDWEDATQVRECELVNLADLKTGEPHIRTRLAAFLTDLADLGVAGIRIDAARHMWPADVEAILKESDWKGYVVQEVIDGGQEPVWMPEYYANGDVTEFRYGWAIAPLFREGMLNRLHGAGSFREEFNWVPTDKALVFVDNHDTQRKPDVLTFKDGALYDLAQVFTLAYPYGQVRVMSSYAFDEHEEGPPTRANDEVAPVFETNGLNCARGEWVCEHRRPLIAGAVRFRAATAVSDSVSHWWTNGSSQIAFGRGEAGFVVINASPDSLVSTLQTGLPMGRYCNRLSDQECDSVDVTESGTIGVRLGPMGALALDISALAKATGF